MRILLYEDMLFTCIIFELTSPNIIISETSEQDLEEAYWNSVASRPRGDWN